MPDDERSAADLDGVDWLHACGRTHRIWEAIAPTLPEHNATITMPLSMPPTPRR